MLHRNVLLAGVVFLLAALAAPAAPPGDGSGSPAAARAPRSPRSDFAPIGTARFKPSGSTALNHDPDPEGFGQLFRDLADPIHEGEDEDDQPSAVILAPASGQLHRYLRSSRQLTLERGRRDPIDGPSERTPTPPEMQPLWNGPSPIVIGADGRSRRDGNTSYPWRAIGWISTGCTGYQIGPRHVLTAGHCISEDGEWFDDIRYYPGRNDNAADPTPYPDRPAFCVITTSNWFDKEWANYDYALIVLPEENSNGWFGYADLGYSSLKNETVWTFGYPGDLSPYPSLWGMSCPLVNVYSHSIRHTCDTFNGQSGSGIYRILDGDRYVVAVHKGGYGSDKNRGPRINDREFDNIKKWKGWFNCPSGCCGSSPAGCCP